MKITAKVFCTLIGLFTCLLQVPAQDIQESYELFYKQLQDAQGISFDIYQLNAYEANSKKEELKQSLHYTVKQGKLKVESDMYECYKTADYLLVIDHVDKRMYLTEYEDVVLDEAQNNIMQALFEAGKLQAPKVIMKLTTT